MAETVRYSIGVDMGGTNLRAAAVDETGKILGKISGRTNLQDGRDAVIEDMVTAIRALRDQCGAGPFTGVGVAIAGFIEMKKGIIVGSNNLPEFDGFPARDAISEKLGTPVILENDANVAALGEKWLGAGRDVEDLVLITLGTGIGGGIIAGGRILHGSVGMAGEIGHTTVVPGGNPCGCGNTGCLEKHASATAISAMARLLQLGEDIDSAEVYRIAHEGSSEEARKARHIFRLMGTALGIAIANMINIFNFPLFLLSGGPLPAWDLFAPAMMEEVNQRSFTYRFTASGASKTRIEKAILGNEAGLYGAAYLPFLDAPSAERA